MISFQLQMISKSPSKLLGVLINNIQIPRNPWKTLKTLTRSSRNFEKKSMDTIANLCVSFKKSLGKTCWVFLRTSWQSLAITVKQFGNRWKRLGSVGNTLKILRKLWNPQRFFYTLMTILTNCNKIKKKCFDWKCFYTYLWGNVSKKRHSL